jgi:hypothetical protein
MTSGASAIKCLRLALKLGGNGQENAVFVMASLGRDAGNSPAQFGLLSQFGCSGHGEGCSVVSHKRHIGGAIPLSGASESRYRNRPPDLRPRSANFGFAKRSTEPGGPSGRALKEKPDRLAILKTLALDLSAFSRRAARADEPDELSGASLPSPVAV